MKKILSAFMVFAMLVATFAMLAVPASAAENTYGGYQDSVKSYDITTVEDFKNFYKDLMVNDGKSFDGMTINLKADITLNNTDTDNWYESAEELYNIDYATRGVFKGTFNGNNHTIKGVYLDMSLRPEGVLGLFPYVLGNGVVKDFTLDGFYIKNKLTAGNNCENWAYARATGVVVGEAQDNAKIQNITVKNGTVTCKDYGNTAKDDGTAPSLGAIVGVYRLEASGTACKAATFSVTGCKVENTVKVVPGAGWANIYCGGLVGKISTAGSLGSACTIDISNSNINPAGNLEPVGTTNAMDNAEAEFKIKNAGHDIDTTAFAAAGTNEDETVANRLSALNAKLKTAKFYGSDYQAPSNMKTITWKVGTTTETTKVAPGGAPTCPITIDARQITETKVIIFDGWTVEGSTTLLKELPAVTDDATYVAQFTEKDRVDITWNYGDGKTLTKTYALGETVVFDEDTSKADTATQVFVFKKWDKAMPTKAEQSMTLTAEYDVKTKYTVTWVIDGKETKEIYLEGFKPSYRGKIEKAEDDEYKYEFEGWDKEIVAVTGDVTYTAQFKKISKNPDAATETEAAETEAEGGCGSMVAFGMVTVMTVGLAGAVVARKKED